MDDTNFNTNFPRVCEYYSEYIYTAEQKADSIDDYTYAKYHCKYVLCRSYKYTVCFCC